MREREGERVKSGVEEEFQIDCVFPHAQSILSGDLIALPREEEGG